MLAPSGATLTSPKLTSRERRSSLFPYYAGYSEAFVRDVISEFGLKEQHTLLDPWNGSGTTTSVATRLGIRSLGIDLNPALAIVAKARTATARDAAAASDLLIGLPQRLSQRSLRHACADPHKSKVRSVLLVAVFRAVRGQLNKKRTDTNPTWWKLTIDQVKETIASLSTVRVAAELEAMKRALPRYTTGRVGAAIVEADVLTAELDYGSIDAVITSPPYLTRIDYVKATLPELLTLSILEPIDVQGLRRAMIGSPIVGRVDGPIPTEIGGYTSDILRAISHHHSKASNTYYRGFFVSYIIRMQAAFDALFGTMTIGGQMAIVVQGSHYKELYVDLSQICMELATASGFRFEARADFAFKQSFAQLNPRAKGYTNGTANESALFFRRD